MNQPPSAESPESPESTSRGFDRRRFVATLLTGMAVSATMGRPWRGTWVASVRAAPGAPGEPGRLRLRIADFPSLQGAFGSVRLGFTGAAQAGPMRPFVLTRDGSRFYAVGADCTHAGCLLTAFPSTRVTTCSCHGSRFNPDGRVVRGPATEPLPTFDVQEVEPGVLSIELPEFPAFEVSVEAVDATPEGGRPGRVELRFEARRNVLYELWSAPGSEGPWRLQPFATTPDGAPAMTELTGAGTVVRVYVEREDDVALLSAAAKIRQV